MDPTTPPLAQPEPLTPASVIDVAEYLLTLAGEMEPIKLHALLYLSQAHHLASTGRPLFDEPIEAWAEGPIVPSVHALHNGETTLVPGFFYAQLEPAAAAVPEDYFFEDLQAAGASPGPAHTSEGITP